MASPSPGCEPSGGGGESEAVPPSSAWFWVFVAGFVPGLLLLSSAMAGLSHGFLALDATHLAVLAQSGSRAQKGAVAAVTPLLKRHHLVLVSLVLLHAVADEALPIVLERVVDNRYLAVGLAVPLVLLFGEVLPAAIFAGPRQLQLTAALSPLAWIATALTAIVTYPIALLLEWWLGSEHKQAPRNYKRNELKAFLRLHASERATVRHGHGHGHSGKRHGKHGGGGGTATAAVLPVDWHGSLNGPASDVDEGGDGDGLREPLLGGGSGLDGEGSPIGGGDEHSSSASGAAGSVAAAAAAAGGGGGSVRIHIAAAGGGALSGSDETPRSGPPLLAGGRSSAALPVMVVSARPARSGVNFGTLVGTGGGTPVPSREVVHASTPAALPAGSDTSSDTDSMASAGRASAASGSPVARRAPVARRSPVVPFWGDEEGAGASTRPLGGGLPPRGGAGGGGRRSDSPAAFAAAAAGGGGVKPAGRGGKAPGATRRGSVEAAGGTRRSSLEGGFLGSLFGSRRGSTPSNVATPPPPPPPPPPPSMVGVEETPMLTGGASTGGGGDTGGDATHTSDGHTKLTDAEMSILEGTLSLSTQRVMTRMIPFDRLFMLAAEEVVTAELLSAIADTAHSRIPVYLGGDRHRIVGVLLVKSLLRFIHPPAAAAAAAGGAEFTVGGWATPGASVATVADGEALVGEDGTLLNERLADASTRGGAGADVVGALPTIGSLPLISLTVLHPQTTMLRALQVFEAHHSHMAVVARDVPRVEAALAAGESLPPGAIAGLITLEDCLLSVLNSDHQLSDRHEMNALVAASRSLQEARAAAAAAAGSAASGSSESGTPLARPT